MSSALLQAGVAGSSFRCGRRGCTCCRKTVSKDSFVASPPSIAARAAHAYGRHCRSFSQTYLSSFSIRSTWVMIMRRQQYRLRPSWSIASLLAHVVSPGIRQLSTRSIIKWKFLTHPECSGQSASGIAPRGHLSPALWSVVVACRYGGEPAHLATGEAAHRDDHCDFVMLVGVMVCLKSLVFPAVLGWLRVVVFDGLRERFAMKFDSDQVKSREFSNFDF